MTSRGRMDLAMRLGVPDRVPVMCQLALGHYFLQSGLDAIEIWHSTDAFAEALVRLQRRYGFDGILVNLPGRDPRWRDHVVSITGAGGERVITWSQRQWTTVAPPDDNPHVYTPGGARYFPGFDAGRSRAAVLRRAARPLRHHVPVSWGFGGDVGRTGARISSRPGGYDTLKAVVARAGREVSVHGEIFSPFSQLMELLDYGNALMALLDDAGKVKACLERLSEGAVALGAGRPRRARTRS